MEELLEKLKAAGIPATLQADGKGIEVTPTVSVREHQDEDSVWYAAINNGLVAEYFRPEKTEEIMEFVKYLLGREERFGGVHHFSAYSACTYAYEKSLYSVYSFFGREYRAHPRDHIATALEKIEIAYKNRKPGEVFDAALVFRLKDAIRENDYHQLRCSMNNAKNLEGIEKFIRRVREKSGSGQH